MNCNNLVRGLLCLFVNLSSHICHSQDQPVLFKPLTVGDKCPDIVLTSTLNYPTKTRRLLDFKGKILLIDFWATWCGSCISSFSKIEKLQHQLKNDFSVLLVTDEDLSTVTRFYNRRKQFANDSTHFAGVYADKKLNQLFPHESIPHYVWIDKKGVIKAITSSEEVTFENISKMMNDGDLNLNIKEDPAKVVPHNLMQPLFVNGNGGEGKEMLWYSLLSAEVKGLRHVSVISNRKQFGYIQLPNVDIYTLYKSAYGDDQDFIETRLDNSRIVFNVRDSTKYMQFIGPLQTNASLYCYNLVTPPTTVTGLKKYMQEDLKKYFGLSANWTKKKIPCLVLTAEDTVLIAPVADSLISKKYASSDYHFISKNNQLKYFRRALSESFLFYSPYPVLDETGYKGNAYFEIEANMGDWQSINSALSKYKMHLTLAEREVNFLIVSE